VNLQCVCCSGNCRWLPAKAACPHCWQGSSNCAFSSSASPKNLWVFLFLPILQCKSKEFVGLFSFSQFSCDFWSFGVASAMAFLKQVSPPGNCSCSKISESWGEPSWPPQQRCCSPGVTPLWQPANAAISQKFCLHSALAPAHESFGWTTGPGAKSLGC